MVFFLCGWDFMFHRCYFVCRIVISLFGTCLNGQSVQYLNTYSNMYANDLFPFFL